MLNAMRSRYASNLSRVALQERLSIRHLTREPVEVCAAHYDVERRLCLPLAACPGPENGLTFHMHVRNRQIGPLGSSLRVEMTAPDSQHATHGRPGDNRRA